MPKFNEVSIEELRKELELRDDGLLWWRTAKRGRRTSEPAFSTQLRNGYMCGMFSGVRLLTHRVVWALHYGEWPTDWLDHINQDTSDNRVENLRIVGPGLSNHNRSAHNRKDLSCTYLGVTRATNADRYIAQVQKDKKHYYVGMYKTEEEAARARDKKALELYGTDAILNFPQ
jgi:hypothetical protein